MSVLGSDQLSGSSWKQLSGETGEGVIRWGIDNIKREIKNTEKARQTGTYKSHRSLNNPLANSIFNLLLGVTEQFPEHLTHKKSSTCLRSI